MAEAKEHVRIDNHLKKYGISQTWLWKKGYVSKTQLSYYLKGQRSLDNETVKRILKDLNIAPK